MKMKIQNLSSFLSLPYPSITLSHYLISFKALFQFMLIASWVPTYVCTYLCIPLYVPTFVCTYLCMYLPLYVPIFVCTYLCMYLPLYVPT